MRNAILLIFIALMLTACSRLELAYEHADWVTARKVANYLDLNRDQRGYLRRQLQDYRDFHRETRIPQGLILTDRALALVAEPSPSRDDIEALLTAAERHVQLTITDLVPLSAELFTRLSPAQIDRLEAERADSREKSKNRTAQDRLDKLVERIETWTDNLTEEQTAFIRRCHQGLPDTRESRLAWRQQKEKQLLKLLRSDADAGRVRSYLTGWWLKPYDRPERLLQARAEARETGLDCIHSFFSDHLTHQQRQHALTQLRSYRKALEGIAAK